MIPSRFVLSFLGFFACALVYSHRAALSVSIVSMVKHNQTDQLQSGSCFVNQTHFDQTLHATGKFLLHS